MALPGEKWLQVDAKQEPEAGGEPAGTRNPMKHSYGQSMLCELR